MAMMSEISGTGGRGHICKTPKRAISSTREIRGEIWRTSGSMLTLKRGLTRLPFSMYSFIASAEVSKDKAVQIGFILSGATLDGIAKA